MSFFSRKQPEASRYASRVEPSFNAQNNAVLTDPNGMMSALFDMQTTSGVSVNENTAMQVTAVYACVSLIAGAIASLPIDICSLGADGEREKIKDDLWYLLNESPNDMYSAAIMWESVIISLLLHGDGFIWIKRRPKGVDKFAISSLEWVHSYRVSVLKYNNDLIYKVQTDEGEQFTVSSVDMIHIPGPGFNGFRGMSQLKYVLRNTAGIALAADQYSASFFKNGARPDFAIELAGKPSQEAQDMIRQSWSDRYQGSGRAHLPALLPDGTKVHALTLNAEDSQLLSTRQFQVEDVCRIYGVPPFMVGQTEKNTSFGQGIEQLGIAFVKFTLNRHLIKIEKEANRTFYPRNPNRFLEFNPDALQRGDYKTRMEGYRIALGRAGEPGWMSVNEIRKKENLAPDPDGNKLNTGISNVSESPTQTPSAQ